MDTFDDFSIFQLVLRHSTDAVRAKVRVSRLDAAEAAQILVALLFPLCHQIFVRNVLFDAILEQLLRDGLPFVEQVEDVSAMETFD